MELKNFNKDKVRRKPLLETGNMVFGKIPPQARDLEEAILGAIMLEKSAFDTVVEILKPECFYVEAHQKIYKAMQSLQIKNLPIDLLTVVEELKYKEELEFVGGAYAITTTPMNTSNSKIAITVMTSSNVAAIRTPTMFSAMNTT